MKRSAILLATAGCLWAIATLRAQELPGAAAYRSQEPPGAAAYPNRELPRIQGADSAAVVLLPAALPPLSADWLKEQVDPVRRERRRLQQLRERLTQQSVVARPAAPNPTRRDKAAWLWDFSIGNTAVRNWSPFPDRALDARTIRFPLPRDARADKRTDRQKALDALRHNR